MAEKPLLSIKDLSLDFSTDRGDVRALDAVSFDIFPGETVGLVGESGCGKSVTALSILRLVPTPPGRVVKGEILFAGQNLLALSERQMRKIRGNHIAMVFQEPMTALNPVYTIGNQMMDVLRQHQSLTRKEARKKAIEQLALVGIPSPEIRIDEYPHMLSGGMRQRVMIAMALSCGPQLFIADEATTALDVTTQAQVLEQMTRLQSKFGMACLLVTHDLGVIAEVCRKVVVMYCGQVIEVAAVEELFDHPRHPYTKGLLASVPSIRASKLDVLPTIAGTVPDLRHLPRGCRFSNRCPRVAEQCRRERPQLEACGESQVACFKPYA